MAVCRTCRTDHLFTGWKCLGARIASDQATALATSVHKMVVHSGSPQDSSRHGKYADLEARKAYKREWMRKRRAG